MAKRIAVLVADHYDDLEYSQPVAAFLAAKHQVSNIAPQAGVTVHGNQRHSSAQIHHSITDISIDDFDALFIPGGKSALRTYPEYFLFKIRTKKARFMN